jgi:hypothetical protein
MYKSFCAFIYKKYVYKIKKSLQTIWKYNPTKQRFYKDHYWWLKPMRCDLLYGQ